MLGQQPQVKIQIEDKEYFGGDEVEGNIILILQKPQNLNKLSVQILGKENTQFVYLSSTWKDQCKVLDLKKDIQNSPQILEIGQHEFLFKLKLPANLSSSLCVTTYELRCSIKYQIHAIVDFASLSSSSSSSSSLAHATKTIQLGGVHRRKERQTMTKHYWISDDEFSNEFSDEDSLSSHSSNSNSSLYHITNNNSHNNNNNTRIRPLSSSSSSSNINSNSNSNSNNLNNNNSNNLNNNNNNSIISTSKSSTQLDYNSSNNSINNSSNNLINNSSNNNSNTRHRSPSATGCVRPFFSRGDISVTATLRQDIFFVGEEIELAIQIHNNSSRNVSSVRITPLQCITIQAHQLKRSVALSLPIHSSSCSCSCSSSCSNCDSSSSSSSSSWGKGSSDGRLPAVTAMSTRSYTMMFTLPADTPASVPLSPPSLIHLSYKAEVALQSPFGTFVKVYVPFTVERSSQYVETEPHHTAVEMETLSSPEPVAVPTPAAS